MIKQQIQLDKLYNNYNKINSIISSYENVTLLGVTKNVDVNLINKAYDFGLRVIGENKVQELLSKYDELNKNFDIHFIGSLQSNKVKYIINKVKMIQSVDSIKLAQIISNLAIKNNLVMDILLQVNIGNEESKSGFAENEVLHNAKIISTLEGIKIKGLMCIGTKGQGNIEFIKMQKLFSLLKDELKNIDTLSMGMSNDYIDALNCKSTMIRVGSALFK